MSRVTKSLAPLLLSVALTAVGCGTDEIAPGNPSLQNVLPDIAFFNLTGGPEVVTFRGTASDNIEVKAVQISFDNGASWKTADIDHSAPYTIRNAAWAYAATVGELPGPVNTVLIKVADGAENVTTSDPFTVDKTAGSSPANLVTAIGSAAAGDFVALSSGTGAAYDFSGTSSVIVVDQALTLVGNGFGAALPAVACTPRPRAGHSPATVLSAGALHPRLVSVGASLVLSDLRIQGGRDALSIADAAGTNIQVAVTDCLFEDQGAWAIRAADSGSAADTVTLSLTGCQVNAEGRLSQERGGILAEGVVLDMSGCSVVLMQDTGGPDDAAEAGAGLLFEDGEGLVTESCFERNSLAIAASGGSLVLSSCQVLGNLLDPTWGVDLKGGASTPLLYGNTINGNTNFGLRIGGRSAAKLRNNVISGNGGSGLVIAFEDNNPDVYGIDLGRNVNGEHGGNDFVGNTYPDVSTIDVQVYVLTDAPSSASVIPAEWNYWGYATATTVNAVVWDGNDASLIGRVELDLSPFETLPGN